MLQSIFFVHLVCVWLPVFIAQADLESVNQAISCQDDTCHVFNLPRKETYPVFYLADKNSLYVGGEEVLYLFDFKTKTNSTISIRAESITCTDKPYCKNYVTLVGQLEGKLLVCGTNTYQPTCWTLNEDMSHSLKNLGERFSPRIPGTNYNILITGNETYSTIIRASNNGNTKKDRFQKIYGNAPLLNTGDTLMTNPHFVKSLLVEKDRKYQDKILLFFREDNKFTRTTERRVSMVAQMCKGDAGPESSSSYLFSTALKSRLICGNPKTGQYYPLLKDVFLLKSNRMVYGLFTNAWNYSAVCSYTLNDIEKTFSTSSLWEAPVKELKVHPGTCLPPGNMTPEETFDVVSKYPELTDWLEPSGKKVVFQSLNNYTKLAVEEVTGSDGKQVIFLAQAEGNVHKVVELSGSSEHVLEMRPFNKPDEILYLELEPTEHVLYVGTQSSVARLRMDDCSGYKSCKSCSRDPYCIWKEQKCQSILDKMSAVQNPTRSKRQAPKDVADPCMEYEKKLYKKNINGELHRFQLQSGSDAFTHNPMALMTLLLLMIFM
ncbi:semaphorin-7A [Rhinophrynus dorsalis]